MNFKVILLTYFKKYINNKKSLYLFIILFILIFYIIFILILIFGNIIKLKLINIDLQNKLIEREKIVTQIIKVKFENKVLEEDLLEKKILEEKNEIKLIEEKELFNEKKNISSNVKSNYNTEPLGDDDSIVKFVTSNKSFNNIFYTPKNLVKISSNYIIDSKWWTQVLKKVANDNLQLMAEHFFNDIWEKIVVVSAYRSYEYQKWIKSRWCPDNLCAKAGYSEHQSWLAVDFWDTSTNYAWKSNNKLQKYYNWLFENAHKYGFHNTYQKWLNIDWYEIEPWHWRYVWKELAIHLKENNLTIAEYYK